VVTLEIRYLKSHLPVFYDVVAFFFLIKVLQHFGWRYRNKIEFLHIVINLHIERLFSVTRTVPKFNDVGGIFIEE